MKEIPILYGTAMVRAQLAGLKTQTRRVVKVQPTSQQATPAQLGHGLRSDGIRHFGLNDPVLWQWLVEDIPHGPVFICPYGKPGDLHWVRETFNRTNPGGQQGIYYYKADGQFPACIGGGAFIGDEVWKPSIFMSRNAARIFNRVISVHIERVQDISREDAIAEGFKAITKDDGRTIKYGIPDRDGMPGTDDLGWPWAEWCVDPVQAYRKLWNSINLAPKPVRAKGKVIGYVAYPWSRDDFNAAYPECTDNEVWRGKPLIVFPNPFVWVTSFKRDEKEVVHGQN